jgi:hypothetical protein
MPDPLDVIAESYRSIVQSTASINATTKAVDATTQALRRQQGLLLAGLALVILGLVAVICFAGLAAREHATLMQNLTLQTEALRRVLQR